MKVVKTKDMFESVKTGQKIKVTRVEKRSVTDPKYDLIRVVNVNLDGSTVNETARVIYADSIRRRYKGV